MNNFVEIPASKNSLNRRKLIYGIGINDANYMVTPTVNGKMLRCPYYSDWHGMLERCYSPAFKEKNPSYKGCLVAIEWLAFSVFRAWMEKQDWHGNQLDKDILVSGNRVYSQDTCLFVSSQVNSLMNKHSIGRGEFPKGVSFHKCSGRYQAKCWKYGVRFHIGTFDTPEIAEKHYLKFKSEHVYDIAITQIDPVRSSLLRISKELMISSNNIIGDII